MRARLAHLWHHNRIALLAFGAVLVVLVVFGVRTISATLYWMDPAHRDQALAEWMSPRYVAQSYDLPRDVVGPALFLRIDEPPRRVSIGKIADENGLTLEQLQDRIETAAQEWRSRPRSGK